MQPSLVQRLRDSVTQCRALDRSQLLTEAADEIARMNGEVVLWRAVASLNVPEREALRQASVAMAGTSHAAWIAGLLERLA